VTKKKKFYSVDTWSSSSREWSPSSASGRLGRCCCRGRRRWTAPPRTTVDCWSSRRSSPTASRRLWAVAGPASRPPRGSRGARRDLDFVPVRTRRSTGGRRSSCATAEGQVSRSNVETEQIGIKLFGPLFRQSGTSESGKRLPPSATGNTNVIHSVWPAPKNNRLGWKRPRQSNTVACVWQS